MGLQTPSIQEIGYVQFSEGLACTVTQVQSRLEQQYGYHRVPDDIEMDRKLLDNQVEGFSSIMMVYGTTTGASAIELHPVHYHRNVNDFVPNRDEYYQKGFYMVKMGNQEEES